MRFQPPKQSSGTYLDSGHQITYQPPKLQVCSFAILHFCALFIKPVQLVCSWHCKPRALTLDPTLSAVRCLRLSSCILLRSPALSVSHFFDNLGHFILGHLIPTSLASSVWCVTHKRHRFSMRLSSPCADLTSSSTRHLRPSTSCPDGLPHTPVTRHRPQVAILHSPSSFTTRRHKQVGGPSELATWVMHLRRRLRRMARRRGRRLACHQASMTSSSYRSIQLDRVSSTCRL